MFISSRYGVFIVSILWIIVTSLLVLHQTDAMVVTVQDADHKVYGFNFRSYQSQNAQCIGSKKRTHHRHQGSRRRLGLSRRKMKKNSVNCACTRIYCPVCSTDKISYGNFCEYRCAKLSNPGLKIRKNGRC